MQETTAEVVSERTIIVGVGASAGGLEAFQDVFSRLTQEHRLAMVLVQHLDPDHDSLLLELLGKRTSTPVQTIEDGMTVAPGNIYLIPPGKALRIENGALRLASFETPRGQRRPIDTFLESLAADAGERAVAIILSGTGSDGCNGVREVKLAGGLVLVQDPVQSKYDGMPRSAIATGSVDLTLNTSEMVDVLSDYFDRRLGLEPAILSDRDYVERVFKHVRYHTGHDFSLYKHSTLLRRLMLRMSVLGINAPAEYLKRLIQDREEAGRLVQGVLINVTGFFRDRQPWDALSTKVLSQILRDRGRDEEVRIWVPGCSTGQEVYTIAMLVSEEVSRINANPRIVIFGTDIDEEALQTARRGVYPEAIADEVPRQFLDTYFVNTSEGYEVGKQLRSLVRFSNQSLIKDPPFSKLDLVTCRNLTIYFEDALQDTAVSVFHYAINPGGYLMLGLSESPTKLMETFRPVDEVYRIYQRNHIASRPLRLPIGGGGGPVASLPQGAAADPVPRAVRNDVERSILRQFAPPYVILNRDDALTYTSPGAEAYLEVSSGELRFELPSLVLPDLRSIIRRLLNRVDQVEGELVSSDALIELRGKTRRLDLFAQRVPGGDKYVIFQERDAQPVRTELHVPSPSGENSEYVNELEQELNAARQTVRTTVEELETSNEELKSSNEEMMSMNEELQSANEELSTINDELQSKVREVNDANLDLSDFIESTSLATVFLDEDLCLRRFTPRARLIFRFMDADVGRPFEDITAAIPVAPLIDACRNALELREVSEMEVRSLDGTQYFIARIVPGQRNGDDGTGLVFTLIDVTELREYAAAAQSAGNEAQRRLEEVEELYQVIPVGMALFDRQRRFVRINQLLADINGISRERHIGRTPEEVLPLIGAASMAPLDEVLGDGMARLSQQATGRTAANPNEDRTWIIDWYPVRQAGEMIAVGVNVRDITDQVAMQEELRRIMLELQHRVKNMLANVKSLVSRAQRDPRDPQVVLKVLSDRIDALARTHTLLTDEDWQSTALIDLLRPELHEIYGDDVISAQGPALRLNARASLAFGLTVHELATNAAKYGAFSAPGGQLQLRWMRVDDGEGDVIRFEWKEITKQPITPPDADGFGARLIQSLIGGSLEGEISNVWEPDGLRCSITVSFETATRIDNTNAHRVYKEDGALS